MKLKITTLLLVVAFLFSSCSKKAKTKRQLKGTWQVSFVEGGLVNTGACGGVYEEYNTWRSEDAGTYEFNGGKPHFEDSDPKAKPGTRTLSYTYTTPAGNLITVDQKVDFDWHIEDEYLYVNNPDIHIVDVYNITGFDKDGWEADNRNVTFCSGGFIRYYLIKD